MFDIKYGNFNVYFEFEGDTPEGQANNSLENLNNILKELPQNYSKEELVYSLQNELSKALESLKIKFMGIAQEEKLGSTQGQRIT